MRGKRVGFTISDTFHSSKRCPRLDHCKLYDPRVFSLSEKVCDGTPLLTSSSRETTHRFYNNESYFCSTPARSFRYRRAVLIMSWSSLSLSKSRYDNSLSSQYFKYKQSTSQSFILIDTQTMSAGTDNFDMHFAE